MKTVKKAKTTSWKDKSAKGKGEYRYQVRAFTYNAKGKLLLAKAANTKRVKR